MSQVQCYCSEGECVRPRECREQAEEMECEECGDIGTRCEGTGELCPDCYDNQTKALENIYPQWLYLKLLEKVRNRKQKEVEEVECVECSTIVPSSEAELTGTEGWGICDNCLDEEEMEEEVVCECINHNEEDWRENCDLVEKIVRKGANKEGEDWIDISY